MSLNAPAPRDVLLIGQDILPLAESLRALDHRVFPVSRAEVALSLLKARSFDLLVLAGAPADGDITDTIRAIRGMEEATAALATLVVWDRLGGARQSLKAAGADRVIEGDLDEAGLVAMLGLEDGSPPPSEQIIALLQTSLRDCLAELERPDLSASRLADLAHRLKGSAASFSLPELAEAARAAMLAAQPGQNTSALLTRLRHETGQAIETVRHRTRVSP